MGYGQAIAQRRRALERSRYPAHPQAREMSFLDRDRMPRSRGFPTVRGAGGRRGAPGPAGAADGRGTSGNRSTRSPRPGPRSGRDRENARTGHIPRPFGRDDDGAHPARSGQPVDVPMRRLSGPEMTRHPRPDSAGPPRAAAVEVAARRQERTAPADRQGHGRAGLDQQRIGAGNRRIDHRAVRPAAGSPRLTQRLAPDRRMAMLAP